MQGPHEVRSSIAPASIPERNVTRLRLTTISGPLARGFTLINTSAVAPRERCRCHCQGKRWIDGPHKTAKNGHGAVVRLLLGVVPISPPRKGMN